MGLIKKEPNTRTVKGSNNDNVNIIKNQLEVEKTNKKVPAPPKQEIKSPFTTHSFSQFIEKCKSEPKPKKLIGDLIYKNELCFLFSSTGLGKTILAIQIAISAASGDDLVLGDGVTLKNKTGPINTIYFDFELSESQMVNRLGLKTIPENLYRVTLSRGECLEGGPNKIFETIKITAENHRCQFIIIDNITAIGDELEQSKNSIQFMKAVVSLVRHEGYTILVVAHTAKIDRKLPITTDSMSGSSKLTQLADSIIGLNSVNSLEGDRVYIKQLKTRNNSIVYGQDNVICTYIDKDRDGFLRHNSYGLYSEHKALNEYKEKKKNYEKKALASLYYRFYKTYDKASEKTGIPTSTIKQRVRFFKRDYQEDFKRYCNMNSNDLIEEIKILNQELIN